MATLDIYQALIENRPYRDSINHKDAVKIFNKMPSNNKLNKIVVEYIEYLFF